MKFPAEWLYNSILDGNSNEEQGIKFIEEEEWNVEHKYQSKTFIFEYQEKFYALSIMRTGTDFNGWTWEDENGDNLRSVQEFDCTEVVKVTITTHAWKGLGANI